MRLLGAFVSLLFIGHIQGNNEIPPINLEKKRCVVQEESDDIKIVKDGSTCVQFTVGQGTGCDWMCNYCANQLGTTNYYFTDSVCVWQSSGCTGNPVAGKTYTCCTA